MLRILRMIPFVSFLVILTCGWFPEEAPEILWERTYGGSHDDAGYAFCKTSGGGFLIAGYTYSSGEDKDFYLVRTDEQGNEIWAANFGTGIHDVAESVCQASDGGFIAAGYTFGDEMYIIKVNSSGQLVWEKTYQLGEGSRGYSVCSAPDGGYVIAGKASTKAESLMGDFFLLKLDESGDSLWTRFYNNDEDDLGICVFPTYEGGYIFSGCSSSLEGKHAVYIVKIDGSGQKQWDRVYYSDPDIDVIGRTVIQTSDGGYVVACLDWTNYRARLLKLDESGDSSWAVSYGDDKEVINISVTELADGAYAGVGYTKSDVNSDSYLFKVDDKGELIWEKTYGGEAMEAAYGVVEADDGGLVVVGETESMGAGHRDAYLFKVK